jgi:hypothetical protein
VFKGLHSHGDLMGEMGVLLREERAERGERTGVESERESERAETGADAMPSFASLERMLSLSTPAGDDKSLCVRMRGGVVGGVVR